MVTQFLTDALVVDKPDLNAAECYKKETLLFMLKINTYLAKVSLKKSDLHQQY